MQLFVSHAFEDKADFARPLAEALRAVGFKVWFDEFELTLGDSLLKKINEGLAMSDYGVVILSPAFFAKKWPQAELDGLFALETTRRKMILPVWKDIDQAGVAKFSPILAGKLAAPASDGVPRVVAEIQRAVGLDKRRQEISALESATERLKKLGAAIETSRRDDAILESAEGAKTIAQEFERACALLESQLAEVAKGGVFRFNAHKPMERYLTIHSSGGVSIDLHLPDLAVNSARGSAVTMIFYELARPKALTLEREKPRIIEKKSITPIFQNGAPGWKTAGERSEFLTTDQLVASLMDQFTAHIERRQRST